jgi:hypothetical protein
LARETIVSSDATAGATSFASAVEVGVLGTRLSAGGRPWQGRTRDWGR